MRASITRNGPDENVKNVSCGRIGTQKGPANLLDGGVVALTL